MSNQIKGLATHMFMMLALAFGLSKPMVTQPMSGKGISQVFDTGTNPHRIIDFAGIAPTGKYRDVRCIWELEGTDDLHKSWEPIGSPHLCETMLDAPVHDALPPLRRYIRVNMLSYEGKQGTYGPTFKIMIFNP